MKTLLMLTPLVMGACGVPAGAQPLDPDPDGMSFYFDTEGMTNCLELDDWEPAVGAGPTVMAYLLVTNPDTPFPSIQAWVAYAEIIMNSDTPTWGLTLTPGASTYDGLPPGWYEVGCGGAAAIPITGSATVIAWAELSWLGTEGHAEATFILRGIEGSYFDPDPGYAAAAGYPSSCQSPFGEWGEVAWINGGCQTIGGEDLTWGAMKELY